MAENQTLEELSYEVFGFQTIISSKYSGKTLEEIYQQHKASGSIDNIIDLTLQFEEFVDKANQK